MTNLREGTESTEKFLQTIDILSIHNLILSLQNTDNIYETVFYIHSFKSTYFKENKKALH